MTTLTVGDVAPVFRLPSAQGGDVGLEDYRDRALIVWFTKGMACPFCRKQMSELARGVDAIRALGAELLQVTPSPPARARFYAEHFRLPFPYLCDPDYAVHGAWGLAPRSRPFRWYAQSLVRSLRTPPPASDLSGSHPRLGEIPKLLHDVDTGIFVLDARGIVRFAHTVAYYESDHAGRGIVINPIPDPEALLAELRGAGSPAPAGRSMPRSGPATSAPAS